LIAELVHNASRRSSGPLVKVNCAALVESLLLSELFGHEKGSFTGATSRRRGRFERASGGTLFLDEIGDISPRTQVALLRVLEERRIERVGGTASIPVDVRIVCATNRDLKKMVEAGQFREDLYYRLAGIALEIPALRERSNDLPQLVDALLVRVAKEREEACKSVSPEALQLIVRYRWPGNVRELENALRAASLFSDGEVIGVSDLVEHVEALRRVASEPSIAPPESVRRSTLPPASEMLRDLSDGGQDPVSSVVYREIRHGGTSLSDLKRNIEKECIARALAETGGNITRAASLLGMKRPRLSQLVKQYELSTEEAS
jgi:transcriptional regulator with GAF, ATPase, and Fis domain